VISIFPWRKLVLFAGSAAAIAVLTWQFVGQEKEVVQPSFADLLEQTDLNEETVLENATLDEVVNFYSSEINAIVEDTTQKSVDPNALDSQPTQMEKNKKQDKKVKPKRNKEHPTINELSEEEILKYLIEEEGDSYEIQ
jgi:pyocin large subunit-like protein